MKVVFGIGLGSLLTLITVLISGYSPSPSSTAKTVEVQYQFPRIPSKLEFAGEEVPLNDFEVRTRIEREMVSNCYFHSNTFLLIQRANRYFPTVERILAKYNIPDDFKYLMVAESGMQNVVSPSGATGFWQFMKNTGPDYGLTIDNQIDLRYDWIASTHAAAKYILTLKERFGSWSMAAAAYNVGPNGFEKYQEKQQASTYWQTLLPEETMRYVPRILALKTILSNPEAYNFLVAKDQLQPNYDVVYKTIKVSEIDWVSFAQEEGISYKTLKFYNPWLRQTDFKSSKEVELKLAMPN